MPRWSVRMRKKMMKRLLSFLHANQQDLASHSIAVDMNIANLSCFAKSTRDNRFGCKVSTTSNQAGFHVAFKSSVGEDGPDDVHRLREIHVVMLLLLRRFDQFHGYDPDAEIILSRIYDWSGSRGNAIKWYTSTPISALRGYTAQQLVARGETDTVLAYLNHIETGGYA